jgi:uncharacterized protein
MRAAAWPATVALVLLAGCGFFSRTRSSIYSLQPLPPAAGVAAVGGLPVAVDVVELPPGLDRKEIVVRQPDLRLEVRETEQWAASLESMVLHTLAFNLARRLPAGMVVLPGQVMPISPTRGIDVVVADLAAGPERRVTLDVEWVLRTPGGGSVTRRERVEVEIASLESEQVAAGTSRALAELADRIVAQLE